MKNSDPSNLTRRGMIARGLSGGALLAVTGSCGSTPSSHSSVVPGESLGPIPLPEPLPVDEIATPALILDLDAFDRNLAKMAEHARAQNVGLRPHAKTHKSPIIAKRQIETGAIGVCAAKVSEAEVMVEGGVLDVLITSPVASADKIERVVALAKKAPGLQMLVDDPGSARDFEEVAKREGVILPVLVGLDTGTRRTGVALGEPALELVRAVDSLEHLRFDGLQAYAGHVMHVAGHDERRARSLQTLELCLETKALVEDAGFPVKVFTGGGTGTFDIDCDLDGVTDLQVGSYIFMDVQYRAIGDSDGEVFDFFEPSLFVQTTAISQPVPQAITVDAGGKSFAYEPRSVPEFRHLEGLRYHYGGDEHGIVEFLGDERPLRLGQKAQLIVSHCDPTVNLYDSYYPVRDGVVTELWPVSARGRSQ